MSNILVKKELRGKIIICLLNFNKKISSKIVYIATPLAEEDIIEKINAWLEQNTSIKVGYFVITVYEA